MSETSPVLLAILLLGAGALCVTGLLGLFDVREAMRCGDFDRMSSTRFWRLTRAFCGCCAAIPVYLATASLGVGAFGAAACTAALVHSCRCRRGC